MPIVGRLDIPPYKLARHVPSVDGLIHLNKNTFKELVRLTREGFGTEMPEAEIRRVVLPTTELFFAYRDSKAVGFTAATHKTNEVYLAAAAIIPSEQGKGLYNIFNRLRIESGIITKGFTNITTRTQNPRVEKGITGTLETLKRENEISSYVITHELITGVYGRMLTKDRPLSSNADINRTYSKLDYEKGDGYFITFTVQLADFSPKVI